ncbi:hypothetical protein DH86_00000232 [Scytalidium sp. 3C]|nr:hypothetical protein DH86_00000232 [Scytalidium sp. 3C]
MERPKTRTYGSKRPRTTAAAAAIFGPTIVPPAPQRLTVEFSRHPLIDITESISNLHLESGSSEVSESVNDVYTQDASTLKKKESSKASPVTTTPKPNIEHQESLQESPECALRDETDAFLKPLQDEYLKDRGYPLPVRSWEELLPADVKIEKIAEASYAEVYRLSNEFGTSIIKVMQLKTPTHVESSEYYTALDVESVVSEFRIMNAVTEIPGFVEFKDAHLVKGRPPSAISKAYYDFISSKAPKDYVSIFPEPESFNDESTFFFIELGDAGVVLDKVLLEDIDILWDVFLGIVVALSRAELLLQFEGHVMHHLNVLTIQQAV